MYFEYVSIAEQKMLALKSIKKLEKSLKRNLDPIILPTSKLATTWWGLMWNKNLERYATFANRIGRGKTYVKNGFVIDLKINLGQVNAYVQGKRSAPYQVQIDITTIDKKRVEKIQSLCQGKLDTIEQLMEGNLPKELSDVFFLQGSGLFPEPKEIHFRCSCPDSTDCCKHVSAVFYGIGRKLDIDPSLFFTLRGLDIKDFTSKVIKNKTNDLLQKGINCKSKRIINKEDIDSIFYISLDN